MLIEHQDTVTLHGIQAVPNIQKHYKLQKTKSYCTLPPRVGGETFNINH